VASFGGLGAILKARLYLLSTVSALALAGNAFAADMPVKAPPPVAAAVFSWTGFYVGAHGGFAWLRHEQSITGNQIFTCNFPTPLGTCRVNDTGAVFGGQIGYNWQTGPNWVIGIEADGSWTGLKETKQFSIPGGFHIVNDKIDWLASLRGRVGFVAGQTLFYGTGGVAFANFNAGWSYTTSGIRAQLDKTTVGWVAGGGVEHAFSRNWSARAEFLHYGLGKHSVTSSIGGPTYTTSFRHDVSVVRLGINFRP
jgi:outer membrane immunogenic protein